VLNCVQDKAKEFTLIPDNSWSTDVVQSIKSFWEDESVQHVYALRDLEYHLNETAS